MKIESSTKPSGALLVKDPREHSVGRTSSTTTSDVQLSSLSTQLLASDDEQTFDTARVSEIKQAISEGRFTINARCHCRPSDYLGQGTC